LVIKLASLYSTCQKPQATGEVCRSGGKQKRDTGRKEGISVMKKEREQNGREEEWEEKGGHRRGVRDITGVYASLVRKPGSSPVSDVQCHA